MPNWSARPTGIDNTQQAAGRNGVVFTASNTDGRSQVDTVFKTAWSVEDAVSQCQSMITRLVAQDILIAQANANLPGITAYIAGLTGPLATG